ncbi:BON domain-containing protein [Hymenobacter sp. BT770]|uniref:BON domain-containing protein n=1 Tax=Hymenobacter sp. BT770 TaxID=2886942 RepID=UPI001D1113B6|nr:BON domain-containing protein [Hymenobacter sp. BT770]MCC3155338.1 BON domain-containing protein [Hymenobacter sp. BT770]MDO3417371.1 BON domain-containing protein [Hymenobacter sp. BT770]
MRTQPAPLAVEERLADSDIMQAVERLFKLKKGVQANLLEVTCREGIVELTGLTDSLLSRQRAEDLAKAVRGVRGVINEISVHTADLPNAELLCRVEIALMQDPATRGYKVCCHTHDGQVMVEGTLQSWAEEQLVLQVLKGVPGVRQLNNRLTVRGASLPKSDQDITALIQELLEWDIRVKSDLVHVRTTKGEVHLSGTVGTAAEHDQAVATAYVAGATRVDASELQVASWALDKELRSEKNQPKADADVTQAILDALRFDPRVDEQPLEVHVHNGVATLLGTIGNLRARDAAGQDAANVVGVGTVHNLLQVQHLHPSPDSIIQEHAQVALANDVYLSRYPFTLTVSEGKVDLYGTVGSHFEQERAAEIVAGVNHVAEVVNHVVLHDGEDDLPEPPLPSDTVITAPESLGHLEPDDVLKDRIRTHFYWSAQLHDQDISVSVHDGRVTLTGTVDSALERRQAAAEAHACGAVEVNNHLNLRPAT